MITKFTIYGERCSGTNYLEELITANFDVELTWEYSHKHFFGFNDLSQSDDTLFIGIVRHPYNWINSLFRTPYHLAGFRNNLYNFLNKECVSYMYSYEVVNDRNMYTNERFKNIFELRHTKIKFLMEDMPNKVKNYIFIRYEDLTSDFNNVMNRIRDTGLTVKNNIEYPVNIYYYKKNKNMSFQSESKQNFVTKNLIIDRLNMEYESKLNYSLDNIIDEITEEPKMSSEPENIIKTLANNSLQQLILKKKNKKT